MTDHADLPPSPDTVDAFYADRACSLRSAATRKTWGCTYRMLQRRHPGKPVGLFTAFRGDRCFEPGVEKHARVLAVPAAPLELRSECRR